MNGGSNRSATKHRTKYQDTPPPAKPGAQTTEWELTDDRLDEALRQTFPASDAVSIIRGVG